jgi:hypothetical protein
MSSARIPAAFKKAPNGLGSSPLIRTYAASLSETGQFARPLPAVSHTAPLSR